jgi:hypothetical protein
MQRPRDINSAALIVLINSLRLLVIVGVISNLKLYDGSTSAETPNPTRKIFEERAPLGDLPGTSSRTLLARPTAKTEQRAWTVFSKAGQGLSSLWNHDGSIVRLEAVGRARRFYYVEPRAGLSARSGEIAFEGVREGPAYSGRAFQFSENCAPLAYQVKGSVSPDESSVKMAGYKPRRDAQCNIVGYVDEELGFNLTDSLLCRALGLHATTSL